jgi:hypothetical protein
MLIRYKDRIFNTATITIARKEKPAHPRAIPVLTVKFVDGSEEQFTGEDVPKVWRLLCAACARPHPTKQD